LNDVVSHLRKAVLSANGAGLTDGQLLERFLSLGDEAAFEAIVRRHGPMVWGLCRRLLPQSQDAEDAFQATFLVFVRKAASIMPREMLGNWLYGVAYRTALAARKTISRQWRKEKHIADINPATMPADEERCDWRPLLDRELRGLPIKYRVPIILCDLEGKPRKEAARQLGWSEGTLSGRLARARGLLAKRLTRRGLALSAGALALALSQSSASAEVPPLLVATTVKACTSATLVAGGVISAPVAALTKGVLRAMFMTKLKTAGSILFGLAIVLAGAGMATFHTTPARWSAISGIGPNHSTIRDEPGLSVDEVPEAPVEVLANDLLTANLGLKDEIVGSGKAVTKEIQVRDFTAVDVGSAFEVEITQGQAFKTTITIDDNLFEYVKAQKEDSTLKIHLVIAPGHSIHTKAGMKAVITMPQLDALSLSGATKGTLKGFKSTKDFKLDLSGASSLKGAIDAGKVDFQASGASKVSLQGSGTDGKLEASGASKVDLAKFSLESLNIDLSGASTATVSVKKKLDYEISGASRLRYRGQAEIGRSERSGASSAHREAK
jgi:RNA polymerase sigma factor (sigma-70 family)